MLVFCLPACLPPSLPPFLPSSFHFSWSYFTFITVLCKSLEKTSWKKNLAWWEEISCLCVQDAHSSWSPAVDSGYQPAVALSFSLVLVPLSLPSPVFLILLELDHTKADNGHPAPRSSLGLSAGQERLSLIHQLSRLPETVAGHSGTRAHFFAFSDCVF